MKKTTIGWKNIVKQKNLLTKYFDVCDKTSAVCIILKNVTKTNNSSGGILCLIVKCLIN